jgi:hypothetical protein
MIGASMDVTADQEAGHFARRGSTAIALSNYNPDLRVFFHRIII